MKIVRELGERPAHELALTLLALTLVTQPLAYAASGAAPMWNLVLAVPAMAALVSKELLQRSALWLLLSMAMLFLVMTSWPFADNNRYLIAYVCLMAGVGLRMEDRRAYFAFSGRVLVGLTFLFAVLWKLRAGEYFNGTFFHQTFLMDVRFTSLTVVFGHLDGRALERNAQLFDVFQGYAGTSIRVVLASSDAVRRLAMVAAYWTLFIEGAVAICFLAFRCERLSRVRHVPLMLFLATTYIIAPVPQFACPLAVCGVAQSEGEPKAKAAYCTLFVLVQFSSLWPHINDYLVHAFG